MIVGVIIGFVLGMLFLALIQFMRRPKLPPCNKVFENGKCAFKLGHEGICKVWVPYKQCPAVIKSGEQCKFESGHSGYHKTSVNRGGVSFGGNYQDYCWNDPKNGVHWVGFF